MAQHFYPIPIAEVRHETADAVSLKLAVPADLAAVFAFRPGQHLTLRREFNAPGARFVLATLGESQKGSKGPGGQVLDAQLAVDGETGKYPEFKGNVATVYTHPMAQGGSGNGHYGGKAEVYMDVGEAMGRAMARLLGKVEQK